MLTSLVIGGVTAFVSMCIQVVAVVVLIRYVIKKMQGRASITPGFGFDTFVISTVLMMLLAGHIVQVGIWAVLFLQLGEFNDFVTAFYHSMVNFAALGYGDIVMSEQWRLLGALEASNGVLMFGLSSGTMMAVMSALFKHHKFTDD